MDFGAILNTQEGTEKVLLFCSQVLEKKLLGACYKEREVEGICKREIFRQSRSM